MKTPTPVVIGSQLRETYSVLYLSCKHSVRHPDRNPPAVGSAHSCDACGVTVMSAGAGRVEAMQTPDVGEGVGLELLTNTSADRRSSRGTANERGRAAKDVIK